MGMDVSTGAQRDAIVQLQELAAEVDRRWQEIVREHEQQVVQAQTEFETEHQRQTRRGKETLEALNTEMSERLEAARLKLEQELEKLKDVRDIRLREAIRKGEDRVGQAEQDCEDALFQLADLTEQDQHSTREKHEQFIEQCETTAGELASVVDTAETFWERRGLEWAPGPTAAGDSKEWSSTLLRRSVESRQRAEEQLAEFRQHSTTRFLDEGWWLPFLVAVLLGGALPLGRLVDYQPFLWWPLVIAVTLLATLIVRQIAAFLLVRTVREAGPEVERQLAASEISLRQARAASHRETELALAQLQQRQREQTEAAQEERQQRIRIAEDELKEWRTDMEAAYTQRCQELDIAWEQEADVIGQQYTPVLHKKRQEIQQQEEERVRQHEQQQWERKQQSQQAQQQLQQDWSEGLDSFCRFAEAALAVGRNAPVWETIDWKTWTPPSEPVDAISLGRYQMPWPSTIQRAPEGQRPDGEACEFPVLMSFPHHASLVLKVRDQGRAAAIDVLQQAMLRLLTSVPAGKIHFTIIDPTGLGQNFSAFMHLADYDERLVGHRIWTEASHISQRLADLTEHMENVIQKYLRNEYDSIQQYNAQAGEVAEPFRVLVVANFPTHFSEEATRRLISIANSGPRCGVYTLVSIDLAARRPRHLQWSDLETHANVLTWDGSGFRWDADPLAQYPLQLDRPPTDELMTAVIQAGGRQARQSSRVEVPFSFVAPKPDEWWSFDSGPGIDVPLGQAGATHRLALKLGRGTSQHVLIAGKTGSGKSTLLHALITNAALHYSPSQLQLYLVDFKKGVEFKPYAEQRLPHARVIAIESEREFGLSVLQKLDQELRRRGDLFREVGVQSLEHFRQTQPQQPMPRILLVVDEFQEFFVSDDKIAHEAALLLDRLVRQGRAFGIHVILGSQTLAGAYSLARSTIGQMAVRIALQCSSADAHLILSEDNTAARLLGRPGEAIYNDANGLLEGNHPFQVVWLSDEQRGEYLRQIAQCAAKESTARPAPIVFEGHMSAQLEQNEPLRQRLESGPTATSALAPTAWLGAAVAIKDPTCVTFHRQSAQNLLLVGQNEAAAQGVLCSCLISLAADRPEMAESSQSRGVQFYLLDGGQSGPAGDSLSAFLTGHLPLDFTVANPSQTREPLESLAELLAQRQQDGTAFDPIFLVIYDLARFAQLQADLDDFGLPNFRDQEQPATPAAQWAALLRDGPAVGIHTLLWVDNYNNLSRWIQRPQLRDFGHRVLFQMSAVDSSQLMDSTAASLLGGHRAILYQDASGEAERFRPYGLPSVEWLERLHFAGSP